ncbi:MAG: hypothetical protein M3308_01575 [Actinomycetota bacterium]|nr:hypothetical protein [Actinomycetota bacterium]
MGEVAEQWDEVTLSAHGLDGLGLRLTRDMAGVPSTGVDEAIHRAQGRRLVDLRADLLEASLATPEVFEMHALRPDTPGRSRLLLGGHRPRRRPGCPRRLLPPVLAQLNVIAGLARDAHGLVRHALLELSSQVDQFAAWMRQDCMETAAATAHYDRAMQAAQETADADMVSSVLSLKSHLAWSVGDAGRAIELAQAGQRDPRRVSDAVLALVTQQEARGHALDGDTEAIERTLDRAAALTYTAAEHPEDTPPWTYFYDQRRLTFQRGIAYVELGRHRDAVPAAEHRAGRARGRGRSGPGLLHCPS